ncbi:T9SS type A sorting domain-containing protein [Rubrivirga marina]|uniref:Secretion system C-terminal sorting domain-containing protein n=1 Tax=Rubrivirga marina TaxID=1196024 RepID=A0A271J4K2_9BACT|nr:T9SS type A sorting domain-containing protein [Rubrivirga marina]PAP78442.1 hypothetical protein BSZ37_19440 [Rubrivirga marina]
MRLLLLVLAATASAQPALVAEASVDKDVYEYGEPIVFRYSLLNVGTEETVILTSGSCRAAFAFEGVPLDEACTLDSVSSVLKPDGGYIWEWTLDPADLGLPVADGTQTMTGYIAGYCGAEGKPCPDSTTVSVSFEAPAYLGGRLSVRYEEANADSVAALRTAYDGVVVDESTRPDGSRSEEWRISGVQLDEAAAALDANGAVISAEAVRWVPTSERFEVATAPRPTNALLTPPTPNPTSDLATFSLRLQATEAVTVDVLDALGRRVAVLHDGPLLSGVDHTFGVEGAALPAGVYVVRVVGETVRQSRRVTVAR